MKPSRAREILSVSADDSAESLRIAWRDLVQVWHPDRFSEPRLRAKANAMLAEINAAYELLKRGAPRGSEKRPTPATLQAMLLTLDGKIRFPLPSTWATLIGRHDPARPDCSGWPLINLTPLPSSRTVSRVHATITLHEDGQRYLRPRATARNGTWVNGRSIEAYRSGHLRIDTFPSTRLHNGDRLRFGDVELVFDERAA